MMTYDLRWRIIKGLTLDALFIWVVFFAVGEITAIIAGYSVSEDNFSSIYIYTTMALFFPWWIVYFIFFEAILETTPGLAAYRLRVMKAEYPVSILRRITSIIFKVLETFPMPVLSIAYIPFTLENARISDKLKNSTIVLMSTKS